MDNNTILVIDDDRNILSIIELYLKKAGFNVATCATGYDALSTFRSVKPTLVVLDVMLPGRDGWSILNDIRQESPTPVIMLTAKGDTGERVRGLELGADDYIAKPFDSNELIARIKAVLRRSAPAADQEKAIVLPDLVHLPGKLFRDPGRHPAGDAAHGDRASILPGFPCREGVHPGAAAGTGVGLRFLRRFPHGGCAYEAYS